MHKIIVENQCGCFKRSDLESDINMSQKDEALTKAIEMKNQMNDEFCGKHNFDLVEHKENFVITFAQQKVSGCCGGGHCD